MSKYTKEDVDSAYDGYIAYKQLAEDAKASFEAMCAEFYDSGDIVLPSGRIIVKKSKTTSKVDPLMLSTLHADIWEDIVQSGAITIPVKALESYGDEVKDCIDSKKTEYFTLKV